MLIKIYRESVCLADDINENTIKNSYSSKMNLEIFLKQILKYLSTICTTVWQIESVGQEANKVLGYVSFDAKGNTAIEVLEENVTLKKFFNNDSDSNEIFCRYFYPNRLDVLGNNDVVFNYNDELTLAENLKLYMQKKIE